MSVAATVRLEAGHAEVRFEGPAELGLVLPVRELARAAGEAFLDGATGWCDCPGRRLGARVRARSGNRAVNTL